MTAVRASQIPNLICIARMVLVWPIVTALVEGRYATALVLTAIAGISDGLDGYLAKRFHWQSRLGGLLDPLADKLLLVSAFLTVTWLGLVPWWLTGVVVVRDIVIVTGGLIYQAIVAPVRPEPSKASKLNTAAQLLFLCGVLAHQAFGLPTPQLLLPLGALVFVTACVSGLDYVLRWSLKAIQARRRNASRMGTARS